MSSFRYFVFSAIIQQGIYNSLIHIFLSFAPLDRKKRKPQSEVALKVDDFEITRRLLSQTDYDGY